MKRREKIILSIIVSGGILLVAFIVLYIIMKLGEHGLLKISRPFVMFIAIFIAVYRSLDKFKD